MATISQTTIDLMYAEYAAITARIAEVLASANPDYSENGRSVSKTAYYNTLCEQRRKLIQDIQKAEGPFEVCG